MTREIFFRPHQIAVLKRLRDDRLSDYWAKYQFPGIPQNAVDMRSIPKLERHGLVESHVHTFRPPYQREPTTVVCYSITDAGRAILKEYGA